MTEFRILMRNGSSTCVVLPVRYLEHLGWSAGRQVAVELLEDGSIWIRVPTSRDYAARAVIARPQHELPLVTK